jgi:hypothetical protein
MVTRLKIADAIAGGFGPRGAGREDLLSAARQAGAEPEVLSVVKQLPDLHYRTLRDLWDHLPDMPVE